MKSVEFIILAATLTSLVPFVSAQHQLWIRQYGTNSREQSREVLSEGAGGVIVAGYTEGDMGAKSTGNWDSFVARFDHMGSELWIRQFGTSVWDSGRSLAYDGAGGVMIAGFTSGSLGRLFAGKDDVFLARFEIDSCYADCDKTTGAGVLDIFDFLCFQNSFVAGETYACDCDTSTGVGVCDVFDFLCFQNAFVGGCP